MKIVVKLSGGIGNQLFQYVFAAGLAKKFNASFSVDVSSFENYSYHHDFELKKLIPELDISNPELTREKKGTYFLHENMLNSIEDINALPTECEILVVSGYWQNENYIDKSVVEEMYKLMKIRYENLINTRGDRDTRGMLAIHIRRRDYRHMGLCSEEYYIACAMKILEINPDMEVALFSDEPNYSKYFLTKYLGNRVQIIKTNDDIFDLYLMSKCESAIISNSTYSWWGAYLNEINKKIIFCPKEWILVDVGLKPCPDRWLKIESALLSNNLNLKLLDNLKADVEIQLLK